MCELLWSDPQPSSGRAPSKRGVGVAFGADVTQRFLEDNSLDLLVRSHEVIYLSITNMVCHSPLHLAFGLSAEVSFYLSCISRWPVVVSPLAQMSGSASWKAMAWTYSCAATRCLPYEKDPEEMWLLSSPMFSLASLNVPCPISSWPSGAEAS